MTEVVTSDRFAVPRSKAWSFTVGHDSVRASSQGMTLAIFPKLPDAPAGPPYFRNGRRRLTGRGILVT